jgi:transcriptional regulator with XRE-family HTH domain
MSGQLRLQFAIRHSFHAAVATSDMTYSEGMVPDAGSLIREARSRHGVSQETLARRARTTQKQISRIEGGEVSPSVSTLSRLLAAMGERLELRADFTKLTASERIAQTAALSRTLTGIAAGGR